MATRASFHWPWPAILKLLWGWFGMFDSLRTCRRLALRKSASAYHGGMTNRQILTAQLVKDGNVPPDTTDVHGTLYEVVTGGFNSQPHEYEQIDEKEFTRRLVGTQIKATEYRQASIPAYGLGFFQTRMFHLADGFGVGVVELATSARFFKFKSVGGCIHEWRQTGKGNCFVQHHCPKCGETKTVDSSD